MLSSSTVIEDNDWDSVRQANAALARDLERIMLSIGQGGGDFGGAVPKSANDQRVSQDGNYGFNAVTTDMLDELEVRFNEALDNIIDSIPTVEYPISIVNGGTGATSQQGAINSLYGVTANMIRRGDGTNASVVISGEETFLSRLTGGTLVANNISKIVNFAPTQSGYILTRTSSGTITNSSAHRFALIIGIGAGSGAYANVTNVSIGAVNRYTFNRTGASGSTFIALCRVLGNDLSVTIGAAGAGGSSPGDGGDTLVSFSGGPTLFAGGGIASPATPSPGQAYLGGSPSSGSVLMFVPIMGSFGSPSRTVVDSTTPSGYGRGAFANNPVFPTAGYGKGGDSYTGTGDGGAGVVYYSFFS
jgi:hypothetical protein